MSAYYTRVEYSTPPAGRIVLIEAQHRFLIQVSVRMLIIPSPSPHRAFFFPTRTEAANETRLETQGTGQDCNDASTHRRIDETLYDGAVASASARATSTFAVVVYEYTGTNTGNVAGNVGLSPILCLRCVMSVSSASSASSASL
ncbi:hypothetical protein V500_10395 [Pseudogymnoascus sp. VKM F-4518 (FW-2643)]|nr:hypothetical protein V500_10395 [Pseudogymnoascus sp. VKM F-4518 (FW-2643)]